MDIIFELHTTIKDPIKIHVNSYHTLKEVHEFILQAIERETIFTRNDILAIFAQDTMSNETLTFPCSDVCVNSFILLNRDYFPIGLVSKNTYKLYIIDHMYRERLRKNLIPVPKDKSIKTSHYDSMKQTLKNFIPTW